MQVKERVDGLKALLFGISISDQYRRVIEEKHEDEIRNWVREYLNTEGLDGNVQSVIEKILASGSAEMQIREAMIASLEGKLPGYEPVLVFGGNITYIISNGATYSFGLGRFEDYKKEHESDIVGPIATVSAHKLKRNDREAFSVTLHEVMRQARAVEGNIVDLQSGHMYNGFFRTHISLVGTVYNNQNLLKPMQTNPTE